MRPLKAVRGLRKIFFGPGDFHKTDSSLDQTCSRGPARAAFLAPWFILEAIRGISPMLHKGISLLPLTALLFLPTTAHAQSGASGYNNPGFEFYGGYSYVFVPYDSTSQTPISGGMNGWDSSLRVPLPFAPQWLGAKGDVSGSYRSDGSLDLNPHAYFFLLGPQITAHMGNSTLWVHGLAGSAHLNNAALPSLTSNSTFALALGGGVDIGLAHRLAWRFSLDYYNTHFCSSDSAVQQIANSNGRVSSGPVFRF
jgi:hypothetical protein